MKFWTLEEIAGGCVPGKISRIRDGVVDAIDEHGWTGATLLRVGRPDNEHDGNRFVVEVQLVPGVVLPVHFGSPEGPDDGLEDKSRDVEGIVDRVVEGLHACRDTLVPLADVLDDLRRRARKTIAGWQRSGLPGNLVDVRLAPYDQWRGRTVPKALVLIEDLGEALQRRLEQVVIEAPSFLEEDLESYRPGLIERYAMRIALGEEGASGTIDQLALNAIARFHDLATFLRRCSGEARLCLPDSTAVHFSEGHIQACTAVSNGPVTRYGDSMTFGTTAFLTQVQLDDAIGKPATTLLDHPFLSPEILVSSVEASVDEEVQYVSVTLNMPRKWFCSVSGRVWEREHDADDSAVILPFRRKA